MEFDFAITRLQAGDEVTIWDAESIARLNSVEFHKLRNLLEVFGQRSAAAQNLRAAITDIWRLRSSDQRLYLHTAGGITAKLLGGLKVGKKKLFIHRGDGATAEIEPLCVLDFYVHESCQRQGVGRALFEHMLQAEQLTAEQLAYDRPSPKLLSFLHKHYSLASYIPQSNNFVLFESYFEHHSVSPGGTRRLNRAPGSSNDSTAVTSTTTASWGKGQQSLWILGSAAASESNTASEGWVPTSLRPPTPSLQRSAQLQTAAAPDSIGWQAMTTGACAASVGGAGCPAAGLPTSKQQTRYGHFFSGTGTQQTPWEQQQHIVTSYVRGAGYKALDRGQAGKEPNTFKAYEQTLLAPAGNPAPTAGPGSARDSLDQFSSMYGITTNSNSSGCTRNSRCCRGHHGDRNCGGVVDNSDLQEGGPAGVNSARDLDCSTGPAEKYPLTPYGGWEPQPGVTLHCSSEAERLSLRRQQEQLQQQQQQQQMAKWEAAGAGPPGHLLAAPTSSYAVPTAGMADIISNNQQQQQQLDGLALVPNSNLISWNGLPVPGVTRLPQQQGLNMQRQRCCCSKSSKQLAYQRLGAVPQQCWDGQLSARQLGCTSGEPHRAGSQAVRNQCSGCRVGSGGGVGHGSLDYGSAKAAAAVFRAGSGAASCLRMT